jgi:hypothetical protein
MAAVLGQMAMMRQCPNGELFAWSVIPRYLPYITIAQISGWVVEWMTEHHDNFHAMHLEALTGKETDIDDINGWMIDQARQNSMRSS